MTPLEPEANDDSPPYIGAQLNALRQRVETANTPGNLDGLMAQHILQTSQEVTWHVDPFKGTWVEDNTHRLEEPAALAVLGFSLSAYPPSDADVTAAICTGLRRLMQRDPFPGDRVSFLHDIRILLGVCLAAGAVNSDVPEFQPWLRNTLEDKRLRSADRLHELTQGHVHAMLSGQSVPLEKPNTLSRDYEHAMAYWMAGHGTATPNDPLDGARDLRRVTMQIALRADPTNLTVPRAALLIHAIDEIVGTSIDQMMLSRSHVSVVLRRFEAAMRRWRWDSEELQHPVRWEVRSEREVQDILLIMLRSVFDDVVDEDPLPKIGHSSYRADFGLPNLGVLVEVKYAYKASDFKKIENEVMIDAVAYLKDNDRYKEIIVFIYDESSSVEHHDVTQRALRDVRGVSDVIVVSRPGVLPVPSRAPAKPRRKSATP